MKNPNEQQVLGSDATTTIITRSRSKTSVPRVRLPSFSSSRNALTKPLTIITLYCVALGFAAPLSSLYSEYIYNYEANIELGKTGIRFTAKAHLEILYANEGEPSDYDPSNTRTGSQLVRLRLTEPQFYSNQDSKPVAINVKKSKVFSPGHDLYANILTLSNGTAYIKQLYSHQEDTATFKNIKKSILLNLLPTNNHNKPIVFVEDNNVQQPEMFSPDSVSTVQIIAIPKKQSPVLSTSTLSSTGTNEISPIILPKIFQNVKGHQNVTFRSRVFGQAGSNLTTDFSLSLVDENQSKGHEKFDKADNMAGAIKLIDHEHYKADTIELQRERRICSNHHCGKSLNELYDDYKEYLTEESLASVEASVAYLRLLERLRDTKGTSANEILALLKKMRGKPGVQSSFLDIMVAARTKESISAAFKHVKLASNDNLDVAERFLSVVSVAAKTSANMHLKRPIWSPYYFTPGPALKRSKLAREQSSQIASLESIIEKLYDTLMRQPTSKWASLKVRSSTLLTLATLINAHNQNHHFEVTKDELNTKVRKLLLSESKSCQDTDCHIVALQALGNVGIFDDEIYRVIKSYILLSGRRESITGMRILRDLLQIQAKNKPMSESFYANLKKLLLRVIYDGDRETTARVLAAESLVRFVPSCSAPAELLRHLPSFGNNELATMIHSRMASLSSPDSFEEHHKNWHWKSCIINGTSTSFVRTMARTESLNVSYGVNVELLNDGQALKDSSFDVFLDTKERTQDLFSLGIFARGLSSWTGSGDTSSDNDEPMTVGMTLKILGGYLRPYTFFTGKGELFGHVWSGTASEPTTAYNGNLLLIDHQEGFPLISGFVAEQQMRGVLSIDVTGMIKISLWHKNSHSVVRSKAALTVQASQSLFTDYDNLFASHLFSFGGQALVDFVADVDFSSSPFKTCLQVTQPEFILRFNSRRHEQLTTMDIDRKISTRTFQIDAKSYPLNSANNKMCSLMNDEL